MGPTGIGRFRPSVTHLSRWLSLMTCLLFSVSGIKAQDVVRINVTAADTTGHYFEVNLAVPSKGESSLKFRMPVWIPGSYLVREFEQHVLDFAAFDENGRSLPWTKEDKNTWTVTSKSRKTVSIRYKVYAFDRSIRNSFLDADRAFINPSSVCMYALGRTDWPITIEFDGPSHWDNISTGLTQSDRNKPVFRASNYDELVDCPIEIGKHRVLNFMVDNIPFELAIIGSGNVEPDTLIPYFERIVQATFEIMGKVPFERYVFFLQLMESGGGGLEHRNSCVMQTSRWSFQPASRFRGFLGLVSHEFFHAWNVKALKPYPLGPFDYNVENYTSMLWIAEGFTSYYGSRILLKAGLNTKKSYLTNLKNGIQRLQQSPGRKVQSLSEASFDAWIKAYRGNENSFNTTISYYSKGALVAGALDLLIRHQTKNEKSLDDVFHSLYREFVEKNPRAYRFEEFKKICEDVAKTNLDQFFDDYVNGTSEIDFKKYLAYAGYNLEIDSGESSDTPDIGMRWRDNNGRLVATRIVTDGAAYHAGVNVGDELVAMDHYRLTNSNIERILGMYEETETIALTISRDGILRKLSFNPTPAEEPGFKLEKKEDSSKIELEIARSWLYEESEQPTN